MAANPWLSRTMASKRRKADGKVEYGGPVPDPTRHKEPIPEWAWVWMKDMQMWGQEVRQDILRLEAGLGLKPGDPGDPPPPPDDDE